MDRRLYTETHEWVLIQGGLVTIGISDHAQGQLGDVVFVELPSVGRRLEVGEVFGQVESVKSASDLYSPVAGTVTGVNARLQAEPELVNQDPLGGGWMIRLEMAGSVPPALLSESAYADLVGAGGHPD